MFSGADVFAVDGDLADPLRLYHDNAVFSLFGPSGTKETLRGKSAIAHFIRAAAAALSAREDEILAITPVDHNCAFVHASAYRQSAANGEEIRYEWAMFFRVEDGLITYGTDMLDPDAQAFWGSHGATMTRPRLVSPMSLTAMQLAQRFAGSRRADPLTNARDSRLQGLWRSITAAVNAAVIDR